MSEPRFHSLHWNDSEARLTKSGSTTTPKGTVLRIEITVTDAYTLSELMRAIQEAMKPAGPVRSTNGTNL